MNNIRIDYREADRQSVRAVLGSDYNVTFADELDEERRLEEQAESDFWQRCHEAEMGLL